MESKSTAVTKHDLPERNLDQEVLKPLITGKFARPRHFCTCLFLSSLPTRLLLPSLREKMGGVEDLGLICLLPSTVNVPWDECHLIHQTQISSAV